MNPPAKLFLLAWALASSALAAQAATPRLPFPQHRVYAPGSLRPTVRNQTQQDADVLAAYQSWKSRYLAQAGTEPDGHPRYRVKTGTAAGSTTVSEGQGYGMLIVVHMAGADPDAQTIFDGLWEFALDHPSTIDSRLMDWHINANEVADPDGNDSAFDGDVDMALALLLAERQWGNAERFDYHTEALRVIAGIGASTLGPASRLPLLGDWVDPSGNDYNQYTVRTSDFVPGHFRAFGRATGDPLWTAAVTAVQAAVTTLQTEVSPATGLLPDFVVPVSANDHRPRPAPPGFLEGPDDGHYYYNAGRDPWRLGTDALISGDATSTAQARKLAQWVRGATSGDPLQIAGGYRLD
ncbi:MAG TPA: glycosyl hydrolase family 8, partial [Thermoanaerobaculia bacterium]|nr:glycosyl hydrolase family 8 [Thermoanaerobaculia bacterium]